MPTATTPKSPSTRDRLLGLLKARKGQWVSGQTLSETLGMSRAAVCKQVGVLKDEGYRIEAATRKGYRLQDVTASLRIAEIRDGLATSVIGQGEARYYDTTDSTNLRAREMAAAGAPEGSFAVAETQTAGRGRLQRTWFSPPGTGIYVSLILRPTISPAEAPSISLLSAVAAAEAISGATGLAVDIKWPNDILCQGRKLAGILTEISTGMDAVDYLIVGLGINVNVPADTFPADIRMPATSVLAETGRPGDRAAILRAWFAAYEKWYGIFKAKGLAPVMARWLELAPILHRRVRVDTPGGASVGEVVAFDRDGFMMLRTDSGDTVRIFSGDVTLL